ncbi:Lipid biosynthetic process [Madurella fahalii]|uniref:Lipid biosynthetic process n=1 Tax=Madurella fahalii TaxID=1157608 RepID=A0ABQ0G9A0_9PEZI
MSDSLATRVKTSQEETTTMASSSGSVYGTDTSASLAKNIGNGLTVYTEKLTERLIDGGWLPHFVLRMGIRREFRLRAQEIATPNFEAAMACKMEFIEELRGSKIAIHTDAANQQHYEVTTGVMAAALGPRMKYSCCLFETGKETLAEAEDKMLDSYVDKMGFQDGMSLIDIGCGWGAAVLYFAERFPNSRVVGFSNSRTQREYILKEAERKGIENVTVFTGDAVTVDLGENLYDRMISCEMFEHLKNYDGMMIKAARALKPGGQFLLHIFCHKDTPYHFAQGWMSTHFFTGGTMPSADLMLYFQQRDLKIAKHWWIHGRHYNQTIEAWLANFVANKERVWPHLIEMYGEENAAVWFNRWQVYYLACAEMFVSGDGDTYGVTHLLFEKTEN